MHFGIDTSNNNAHPIDWAAAYAALKSLGAGAEPFVIHKVTQGTGFVDSTTAGDVVGARVAGFKFQAGYLMDQGNASVAAEESLYQRASALPQADDIELPEGLSVAQYIAHARELVNIHPDELSYLNQSEEDEGFPEGAGIWEANYNRRPGEVHHGGVLIHQYDDAGVIPGCAGQFDMNAWVGTEAAFVAFFGNATVVTQLPTSKEDTMHAVVMPNGDIKVYAADPHGHLLEFTRHDADQSNSAIDITNEIGLTANSGGPFLVAP